jgi:hypothetical protein
MAGYIGSKASVVSSGAERKKTFAITTSTTLLTGLSYTPTKAHVFHNGVRLVDGTDYTATDGTSITLNSAAESGDEVVVISYAGFQVADAYTQAEADAEFVAKAGDTMTGGLTVGGSFTSLGIDDNATSTAVTIDSSGRVTMPYQPAFCAYKSAVSTTSYGAGNIVSADMTSTKYNVGGHYNTSNGRFTAPISGLYLFWCSLFNNTASVARLRCDINGGAGAWGQGQSAAYSDWAITGVAKLNAGDYVHLTSAYAGTTVFHDINHSSWGGYLIG